MTSETPSTPAEAAPPVPPRAARFLLSTQGVTIAVAVLAVAGLGLAWRAVSRLDSVEQALVLRQQDQANRATEAHLLAKEAQEGTREALAKLALLEARLSEVSIQRSQLDELIQSLSRSRDENILLDIDAAIRVAMQQASLTGSAEPLVSTLRQSEERLARYNQPRLDGVRRAAVRDLDRIRAAGTTDVASLAIKLDEAARMVDELPLLSVAPSSREARHPAVSLAAPTAAAASAARGTGPLSDMAALWSASWRQAWSQLWQGVWAEARSLVRVTRVDAPQAMFVAPEQAYFIKENLKLRLLNARLGLLSRQFEVAQADLGVALKTIDQYVDKSSRRTQIATELLRQVVAQAKQVVVPRPDNVLAALTAANVGR